MFWNKEIEALGNSIISFCENRLKDFNDKLTAENKDIFRISIHKIRKLMRD